MMSLSCFALLFLASPGHEWVIKDTGVTHAIVPDYAAVMPDQSIWIMDTKANIIRRFSANGELGTTVDQPGKGRGKFGRVLSIYRVGKLVYVHDLTATHVFNLKGDPVRTVYRRGEPGAYTRKVSVGWIVTALVLTEKAIGNEIYWVDEDLKNRVPIASTSAPRGSYREAGKRVTLYNPNPESYLFAFNETSDRMLLRTQGSHRLVLFNVRDQTKSTISVDLPRTPFDQVYGRRRLASFQRYSNAGRVEEAFPKYFPHVSRLRWHQDGYFGLYQHHEVNKDPALSTFLNSDGQKVSSRFQYHEHRHILHMDKQGAYLSWYSRKTGKALLMRLPGSKVAAQLKVWDRVGN